MQINPTEKFMSTSATSRIHLGIKNLLHNCLDNWRERRVQVRGNAIKAELSDHLLRDIGHDDAPHENERISERRKADIRAFNMQLLRTP